MDLFTLTARLVLDDSDYRRGLMLAKTNSRDFAVATTKDTKQATSSWLLLGGAVGTANSAVTKFLTSTEALGATLAALGIIEYVKMLANWATTTMNYADSVGDLAEQWGLTTRQIQEFDYWASQNGTTLENLLTGMRSLVNQAQAGSDAFEKLGVSVTDTTGKLKDQRTLFLETITALQKVDNQTERVALQFDVFGRTGIELGQVINLTQKQLEELSQKAEDYGLIISDKAIKASSDFNDELDTLKKQFRSTMAELVAGDPQEAYRKFEKFMDNLMEKLDDYVPKFVRYLYRFTRKALLELPKLIEPLVNAVIEETFDYLASLDWATIGVKLSIAIVKGLLTALVNTVKKMLTGEYLTDLINNNQWAQVVVNQNQSAEAISTITSANVSEKTTKVDEKLDITLSVESDGTVAGEQNLNIISDMLTDKINKALGDMVNG